MCELIILFILDIAADLLHPGTSATESCLKVLY